MRSERRWGAWDVVFWAKARNLTDKKYVGSVIVNQSRGRTIEPAPGRQLDVGVNLSHSW
jgi:iron complex outermembrane receptor protein